MFQDMNSLNYIQETSRFTHRTDMIIQYNIIHIKLRKCLYKYVY